jgi:hypothetical protein
MANTINHGLRAGTVLLFIPINPLFSLIPFFMSIIVDLYYNTDPLLHDRLHNLHHTTPWYLWPLMWPMIIHSLEDIIYHSKPNWWPRLWWLDISTFIINVLLILLLIGVI